MNLDAAYAATLVKPSDINELLPVLHDYAAECENVTEFGTRFGASTTCFLHARPKRLTAYDLQQQPGVVERLAHLALEVGVRFRFVTAGVRHVRIKTTDLLFIDTWHVCEQLRAELYSHSNRVRRYIAIHDTVTFGEVGETAGHRGLWPAIIQFLLDHAEWKLIEQRTNNGLTILGRRPPKAGRARRRRTKTAGNATPIQVKKTAERKVALVFNEEASSLQKTQPLANLAPARIRQRQL